MFPGNQLEIENLLRGLMGGSTGAPIIGDPQLAPRMRTLSPARLPEWMDDPELAPRIRTLSDPLPMETGEPARMASPAAPAIRGDRYEINN